MQDAKQSRKITIRPLILLISLAGFLTVYLTGLGRSQSLTWISMSSTAAFVLLLTAGLVIELLLNRQVPDEEPAAIYEPRDDHPGEQRPS